MKTWQALLAVLVLAALLFLGLRSQWILERGLPPRTELPNERAAYEAALAHKKLHGGEIRRILGTGSMAPYIPAAAPGRNPKATVVAYVVTVPDADFDDIRPGNLVTYRAAWNDEFSVIHGAALKDSGGWIMSGLANERSEAQWRVTRENFLGLAAATFTWPQR